MLSNLLFPSPSEMALGSWKKLDEELQLQVSGVISSTQISEALEIWATWSHGQQNEPLV